MEHLPKKTCQNGMLITCWCALSVERKCGILIKVISCSANGYFINYYFRDFSWKGVIKYG